MGVVRKTSSMRVLEPIDRISEVLFGLIMVLTFTSSLSVAESGQSEVRAMLVGALGCNLAWGLIDSIMYLMGSLAERGAGRRTVEAIRQAATDDEVRSIIAGALPSGLMSILTPVDLGRIRSELSRTPVVAKPGGPEREDWVGAAAVFVLVFLSTIPVVLPFVILSDAAVALRISNAIAVVMMAVAGYAFGRLAGYRPWVTAGSMVLLGCLLVALTIALGG